MDKFAIAIHAGAEDRKKKDVSPEKEKAYLKGLEVALQAGWEILNQGGSAVAAVEAAVKSMEDCPLFNAGRGASLTQLGETEFDAAIMDGKTLQAGAVGGIRYVKNPVGLARLVMEKCSHVFITGTGAEEFALKQQVPFEAPTYFITAEKEDEWLKKRRKEKVAGHDTVGAVARDKDGNLAVATSTGGLTFQMKGRIGDSPLVGGGTYANNETCAVSCTGDGEVIMRGVLAHEVSAKLKYTGCSLQEAADHAIMLHDDQKLKGGKGLIAVDPNGDIALAFNTTMMKRAYRVGNEDAVIAVWKDDLK